VDPLTEMHLILREAGWTPETGEKKFYWLLEGCNSLIITSRMEGGRPEEQTPAVWFEYDRNEGHLPPPDRNPNNHMSVDALRLRLKELAK
jgi:hypothetical protein